MSAIVIRLSAHTVIGATEMDQTITGLTTGGFAMMTLSIGLVTALATFCIHRILRNNDPPPHDIDTRNT